ncbi:DsbA family protein [Hoyosella sp. YIM 151337]|uniref:DsbA family protein n=1 Tax=Hoyosella sp. YIM 151337 TaxID=2992742 RepID=UPI002235AC36|nr:DsbA family protein [Hoyosella sp. YIM 151337]MCW4352541.1 DsbA family protein [Hoyosella sp. YIM 151337]
MNQRPKPGFVTQQQLGEKRRAMIIRAVVTGVILLIAVVIAVVVINQRSADEGASPGTASEQGIAFGPADAAVTLEVYEDFQCPACRQFETISGDTLRDLAETGEARVVYHPIAILDRASTTQYSTRAASAARCVAEHAPEAWLDWQAQMYAQQPTEGGAGLTNEQMLDIAGNAGADSEELTQCVSEVRYANDVANATAESSNAGVRGTPTVLINGDPVDDMTPDGLRAAVQAAQ